jgi:putative hemolysin
LDPESSLFAIGIVLCLVLLAFASAVDAALSAISRHRLNLLQEESATRASMVERLLSDPYRFKAVLVLINAGAIIAVTALTLNLTSRFARAFGIAGQSLTLLKIAMLAVLLLLVLILSEALPKALATRDPARAARLLAGPMSFITRLLWPLINVISVVTTPIVRLLSGHDAPQLPLVTQEELRLLVNVGEEEGLIEPDERQMIEGIFSFGDTVVREVMIPRVDIKALEETASLDEALDMVIAHGHSRIPVFHETIDQLIGILYAKDLLKGLKAGQAALLPKDLLRPPHFVPETMKVDALLKDLQTRKVHLAIVVDEYGGTAGLVTIEDLLEEIVGEIQDEYDVEEPSVRFTSDGELVTDARVLLDDLNELAGLHLEAEEADRVGGLVYEQLGRVPQVGDEVHIDDVTITVLSVEGLRPRQLQLNYPPTGDLEISTPKGEAASHDDSA